MPLVKSRSAGGYSTIGDATPASRLYGTLTLVPSPLEVIVYVPAETFGV
jgi:hypothetical protein